ncbi:MAG: PrgI family protein [Patescibacteria group bacterium]
MQFKVPQFLEIEDKIFGPFTFKQFVYLVGGAGICFVLYRVLGFVLGAIPILAIGGFAAMLAFYRPNGKPFLFMVESGFKYIFQSKLYIWKAETDMPREATKKEMLPVESLEARLSGSKLRDLAWSLDVLDLKKQ